MTNFSGKPLSPKTGNAACGGPQGGGMDSRRNGVAEVSPKYLADIATNGIPVGYMQTEIGMIPEDWEVQDFGSLFQSTVSKKTIKPGTLVSFVGMQDVTERAQLADQHLIPIENVRSGFTYFERGDVLIAKITPCFENGKGCHTELLHSDIGFGSTEFHVLRANDISDSRFIYYWSNREVFRKSLESEMVGSAGHRRVPLSAISNYQIPVPPKAEQTAIAQALSDVDALISELEKLIAKKQAIKTATMQQLLTGRTRLPQFAMREDGTPKGTKPSELGEIPEDWDVFSLLDIANLVHGKAHEPYVVESGEYVVVNSKFVSTEGKVRKYCSQNDCAAKKGDILMVLSDLPNGKALAKCFYADQDHVYAVNQRVCIFRTNVFDSKYLQLIMNRHKYFLALDDGVTQTHILNGDIAACQLFAPVKRAEQTAIATILSDMDAEIQALEQRLGKTRQIKQGMMQELLTGKTRLIKGEAHG